MGVYPPKANDIPPKFHKMLNVKCKSDYGVQNDESLRGHCTNEKRVTKRDKKVRSTSKDGLEMLWLVRRTCDKQSTISTPGRALPG